MKEISRRAKSSLSEGVACGPVSTYAVEAEIVVEDEGKTVYLHGQFVDEVGEVNFEAHTESIYDVYMELEKIDHIHDKAAFNTAVAKRDRIDAEKRLPEYIDIVERYAKQYEQILQMIRDVMDEDGMEFAFFEEDEEL